MLLDLFKLLFDLKGKSDAPAILKLSARERLVFRGDQQLRESLTAPPRQHTVQTLQSLIDFAKDHLGEADTEAATVALWHSDERVVAVMDDTERLDVVTFEFIRSEERKCLEKCKEMAVFSQPELVDLLRYKLHLDPSLVAPFRTLSWVSGGSADADIQFGASRLGRTASASVTGAIQVPDTVPVMLPLFQNLGERAPYRVVCDVDLDSGAQTISFGPQPGALQAAIDAHQLSVADRLREALPTCLVYYGSANLPKLEPATI